MSVAIIGAGLAGLQAARVLTEHDVEVEIFEASDRVGGRVRTEYDADGGSPIELGPEFVHGRPHVTVALAKQAKLEIEPVIETHHLRRGGRLVELEDVWGRFAALLRGARHVPDQSARTYLEHAKMRPADATLFTNIVEGFYAAPLDDISIRSVVDDASGGATEDTPQAHLRGGYARLVHFLCSQLTHVHMHFDSRVRTIEWSADGVRIELADRWVRADHAIVTVPLGVLQAGDITFHPPLTDHAEALAQLAMGPVVKIVVCLRQPIWAPTGREGLSFVHADDTSFPTFWMRSHGTAHHFTAWAGGPHARKLAGRTAEQLADLAIADLATTLNVSPGRIEAAVRHHHFHDYQADPLSRGAYSYTRVGGGHAAEVLARPLGDRVFLAGEATDAEYEGTVAGALASGLRAAKQILR